MARLTLEEFEHKFQDYLEKLKVVEYTKLNRVYQDISNLLTSAINELDGDLSSLRRSQLNKFLGGVAKTQKKMMDASISKHLDRMEPFAGFSYQVEAAVLYGATGATILHSTKAKAIYQAAIERPIGATGDLLEPFVKNLSASQVSIVEKTLRKAHVNGWTSQETLRTLKGSKAQGYADGLMSRLGKQTAVVVRTSMQHLNNSARQTVWGENADIIKAYQWVSTLDDRTSEICQDLDGQIFPIDEGPMPPAHPNCRSTTVAVLDDAFSDLSEGRVRSSEDGYVDADITYKEWLTAEGYDE